MDKVDVVCVEYNSATKKNEIVPLAATWIDPEIIILSKISQKERQLLYGICGLSFPTPENLPDPGIKPASPVSLEVARGFFTTEQLGKPYICITESPAEWQKVTQHCKPTILRFIKSHESK